MDGRRRAVNLNKRQQLLAIFAGAVVALFLADQFILAPLTKSWTDRSKRIAELRKSIHQGNQLLEREQTIRSRWQSMRTNTLPENTSAAEHEVLKAFDRWSQDSGISVSSIRPQWRQRGEDYQTLECRADAFGSIQAVTRFLYNLERDPLALKVDSLEITARDNEGRQLAVGLQVSGLLLRRQEP
jgi:Tfp pilus assembly protein PilN